MSYDKNKKVITLRDAVRFVRSGDMIGIGGMTLYRKPMGFIRELIRSDVNQLTLLGFTSSFDAELLATAEMIGTLRTCYFGLEYLGLAPYLRQACESSAIRVIEETENSIALGLQASLMRVPFLPSRDCGIGTDYFRIRNDLHRANCPVTGEPLTWFPAITPKVAIIHVPMSDAHGNAWLGGQHCIDSQLAMAADITILTAERIVDTDVIRNAPGGAGLLSFMVDAVVEVPGGAHPTSCFPDYPVDIAHITQYLRSAKREEASHYLNRFVRDTSSELDYVKQVLEVRHEVA